MSAADDEFPKLLDTALAEAKVLTQQLTEQYRLYEFHDWRLDEKAGHLIFGRDTKFDAQIIGFRNPDTGMFTWAWADETMPEFMLRAARQACAWGRANNLPPFLHPGTLATVEESWKLTAFAARLANLPGIYAGQSPGPTVFLAFAPAARTL